MAAILIKYHKMAGQCFKKLDFVLVGNVGGLCSYTTGFMLSEKSGKRCMT